MTSLICQEPTRFALYEGSREQFIIWLPEGWVAANDESKEEKDLMTPAGKIVFGPESAQTRQWRKNKEIMEKYDTGELSSFSIQRFPLKFDICCRSFPETARREVLKMVYKDPMFDRKNKPLERFRADSVVVGGCVGIRIKGRTQQPDGTVWVMDTYAFADGEILYLFTLKNMIEHYDRDLPIFEQSVSTLRIIRQNITKEWPYVLPERALELKNESEIGMQIGMAKADPNSLGGMVKMLGGEPVDIFLMMRNKSKRPIWAYIKIPLSIMCCESFREIGSDNSYIFIWGMLTKKEEKEIPIIIKIFEDENQTKLLVTDSTKIFFASDELEELLEGDYNASKSKKSIISGWKTMNNINAKLYGTLADSSLQGNIAWEIFKNESLSHKECEHAIVKVELADTKKGILLQKAEDGLLQFEEDSDGTGERIVEKWYVKSCEFENVYEVRMLKSPRGEVYLTSVSPY